jgi:8-oxo-dGTP pyrophosphatase MutT (NUDIX family)
VSAWTTYSAAGAVVVDGERVLLVRQRRAYGVHWELPGGYDEDGESLEETAAREVREETGLSVDIGELVCTLVWERRHDARRNVIAYFLGTSAERGAELRPQVEEEIEAAEWLDPVAHAAEVHPLHRAIFERWWSVRNNGFHVHVDVSVAADGTQSYAVGA